jgi:hypothetical protein
MSVSLTETYDRREMVPKDQQSIQTIWK